MKIKRYTASSMRLALAQVRAEQGEEAVILSSRRIEEGVEVVAAVDYDETLIPRAAAARTPQAEPAPAPVIGPDFAVPAAPGGIERRASEPAVALADPQLDGMRRELQSLRLLLETELASLSWHDKARREPLQTRILEELLALDIAPDVARMLAGIAPKHTSLQDPANLSLALLARHLPLVQDATCTAGGVVAIVGPTGVGKTTTIAKLAARWALRNRSAGLAIVSTDSYRIGAREQLQTYARILGCPLHAADSARELAQVLERLHGKQLVLIDTAGVGPRDARLGEQLAILGQGAPRASVMLALPAQGEAHALQEITAAFAPLAPRACILTKVDEAASFGAALSTAVRHRLPIAYLCNGQRVPEDVHSAHQRRIWLVRAARQFKERQGPVREAGRPVTAAARRETAHA
jgi:flagellar biosynthesis protein FlhF